MRHILFSVAKLAFFPNKSSNFTHKIKCLEIKILQTMKSLLIKDTTVDERMDIVKEAL